MTKIKGRNKWKMYQAMRKNKKLAPYLVYTKQWNKKNFNGMLSKYNAIVVKPNNGLKARSIYFISKKNSGFKVQIYERKYFFSTSENVYDFMKKRTQRVSYIIQNHIDMEKINDRPFDIRVIIQRRSIAYPWTVTAYKVRVAGAGKMVTNASKGGRILTFKDAMQKCDIPNQVQGHLLERLKYVSIIASLTLSKYYPYKRLFGIDIGIKKDGSLHIFEINRQPLLRGFSKYQQRKIRRFKHPK
ncbi:hypothetical protein CR203_03575 [Salipaludibacillus neizhouensis]|uniref:ATP-grasp domain-containing protein n=1 Tax=Salipaludibacillus neizhouensis TaxID=885475 RepID=A0A3A9KBX2_9BACI|nr:YheC/YheD family protein [Salipaludibacillus neizhouensis]RKL69128.1 hypothetical protein CR203_03575 [Salipaludibacillus neizhouensis]